MRRSFRLTAGAPSLSINVDFQASTIVVDNPTGSPVFLRTGAPDIPQQTNADLVIPAASSSSHATSGRDFGAALGDPSLIETSSSALSGLFDVVVLTVLDASEQVPSFGSFSFLSLSLTDLYPLRAFTPGYVGPFDLGPWGGLHVLVLPTVGSGQGICQVEVKQISPDVATGWSIYGQWAFWPGLPLSLTLPRTTRYIRLLLNNTAIPGEPAVTGSVAVRASMAEIAQLVTTPSTTALIAPVNVGPLGQASKIYATVGLRAVTARLNVVLGIAAELILYTASSPVGPWALVTFREQSVAGFYNSIARTIGQLDAYLRLDVLDIGGGGLQTTLAVSMQEAPDLTGYLGNILGALGDVAAPTSVGQSIYSRLSQIHGDVDGLETAIAATNTRLDTLHGDVDGLETAIAATNTRLDTLHGDVDGLETAIAATNTRLDTLIAQPQRAVSVLALNITYAVANAYTLALGSPAFTAGHYIVAIGVSYQVGAPLTSPGFFLQLALGTASSALTVLYGGSGVVPEGTFAPLTLGSQGGGGVIVPAGQTYLWILCTEAPAFVVVNIGVRSP